MALPSAYSAAWFRSVAPPEGRWPTHFAIVTAYNPDGRMINDELNHIYDKRLAGDLERDSKSFWRVTGGSADFSHAESGYAIEMPLDEALALGKQLRQQAIFWVEEGNLFLVNCADGHRLLLGLWPDRLDGGSPTFQL